jgi:RNA polymerase sigma-70 factor (ECF subfamily)
MDVGDLYQRYGPMVMRRCRHLLGDEHEALDATQDVFVQVVRRKEKLTVRYPSSLLFRIATNLCLNRIRDRARHGEAEEEGPLCRLADLDEPESRFEARSILARLFGQHDESTRTIAVLHYLDGMTLEETAQEVGMSVSGVRKRLRALRADLKEIADQ